MPFWFFKKRDDREIEEIHATLDNSFSRIREDMGKVSEWINHFHERHKTHERKFDEHNKRFDAVSRRLDKMEFALAEMQAVILDSSQRHIDKGEVQEQESIESEDSLMWMELTEAQQKLCWKIAALQKESPNEWISLKALAQEVYPDKDYASVRSTICQFTAQLEELGFIKRKRKGRQSYVCSTDKNPYKDKARKKIAVKAKVAKKN